MARVVIGAATARHLEALVVAFRAAGGWEVTTALSAMANGSVQPGDAYVLSVKDVPSSELPALLVLRESGAPLVVIGAPGGSLGADAWLPESAPARVVVAIVSQLLARGEAVVGKATIDAIGDMPDATQATQATHAPISWRRKSDMLVGNSLATRQLLRVLDRVAGTTAPVTITGEAGTGKALAAQAIHYCGPRAAARFASVRCAGVTEHVFDEELATGGTVMLDEVGDLAHPLQTKLLWALEKGTFVRWDSRASVPLAARVVATTTRDAEADVRGSVIHDGLWTILRPSVVHVHPLRDRTEDIAPIVHHHLALIARRETQPAPRLTAQALERLLSYEWPGNVRELVDILERAFLMAEDGLIDAHHIVLGGVPVSTERLKVSLPSFRDAKSSFEYAYYSQLMRVTGGNVSLAAKLAMKTRKEIYDALRRLGLNATAYRGPLAAGGS